MESAQQIARQIQDALPEVKSGTLRFWGHWFGRPHDNQHQITHCEVEESVLRISFDQGEVLTVWQPVRAKVSPSEFKIGDAHRVRWEWFYYGRPKTPANLYFQDFSISAGGIVATTNVDWYKPEFKTGLWHPAVEIV